MKNIAKAILAIQTEIKGLEKDMQVGSGNYGYKGIADYEVKKLIKPLLEKNGLVILPISITPSTKVDSWTEDNKGYVKRKQSVFTEVQTKYMLLHSSGESIEIAGYGHGVDSQDKGAGKATTYALKYALLYTFFVPTGKIDDSDNTHSNDIKSPQVKGSVKPLPKLEKGSEAWNKAVAYLKGGGDVNEISKKYSFIQKELINEAA